MAVKLKGPSPLQTSPTGLLGSYELKVTGENPSGFGDVVTPVTEVQDFYLANALGTVGLTTAVGIGTQSGSSTVTVPAGYVYRVLGWSAEIVLGGADIAMTAQGVAYLTPPVGSGAVYMPGYGAFAKAGTSMWLPGGRVMPLILPAGWRITVAGFLSGVPAAAWNLRVSVLTQPFLQ